MAQYLSTGGSRDPFLPRLLTAIHRANEIDLAVAFIKSSGLALIFSALADALGSRGARLRILTSDYLDVTDPQALRQLMLLAERGADVRVFQSDDSQSFHLKTYICLQTREGHEIWGAAFVGSSNISRTTLTEYYRSVTSLQGLRRQQGHWWALIREQGDLEEAEVSCLERHKAFFRYVEVTQMTKCFKAVLLESLIENDGFRHPTRAEDLAAQALEVFRRRRDFVSDIREDVRNIDTVDSGRWLTYWMGNPINALIGGNIAPVGEHWFELRDDHFRPTFSVTEEENETFQAMVQELVDYRLAAYAPRLETYHGESAQVVPISKPHEIRHESEVLPYFPNLRIACGHFRSGRADVDQSCRVRAGHGHLHPSRHFVACATGNSMNGGKQPVKDGDYLLLELVDPSHAGAITGSIMAIERQDVSGDNQYLLRLVTKTPGGRYILKATNSEYPDYEADDSMHTLARLKTVLPPEDIEVV